MEPHRLASAGRSRAKAALSFVLLCHSYLIEQVRANGIGRGIPSAAEAADVGSLKTQENPQASGAFPI